MRRSTRKVTIPPGYIIHDGRGCPLPDDERPGTINRIGSHVPSGRVSCAEYTRWAEDPWTWDADHPGAGDIIAYEPEMVEIPRMSYDQFLKR